VSICSDGLYGVLRAPAFSQRADARLWFYSSPRAPDSLLGRRAGWHGRRGGRSTNRCTLRRLRIDIVNLLTTSPMTLYTRRVLIGGTTVAHKRQPSFPQSTSYPLLFAPHFFPNLHRASFSPIFATLFTQFSHHIYFFQIHKTLLFAQFTVRTFFHNSRTTVSSQIHTPRNTSFEILDLESNVVQIWGKKP